MPNSTHDADQLPSELIRQWSAVGSDELLHAVRADQTSRWRHGRPIRCETYFSALPQLAANVDDALVLIGGEAALRRERGENVSSADFASRFPQYQEMMSLLLMAQQALGTLSPHQEENDQQGWPEIPGCTIESEIGRGAMGIVYRAKQHALGRDVAVKVLLGGAISGAASIQRFRNEAQVLARLRHPNIVQVFDVGEAQTPGGAKVPFIALEYIEGPTLAKWARGRNVAPVEAANIVQTLAEAIEAAHQAGVVHRDLKPANVLIVEDCQSPTSAHGAPTVADNGVLPHIWWSTSSMCELSPHT